MAQALPVAVDCCSTSPNCSVTVVTGSGSGTVTGWYKVISLAQARAIPESDDNEVVTINGSETSGDLTLGFYTWDSESVAVDDGASVLTPDDSTGAGRWIRQV